MSFRCCGGEVLKGSARLSQSAGSAPSLYLAGNAMICSRGSFDNLQSGRDFNRHPGLLLKDVACHWEIKYTARKARA